MATPAIKILITGLDEIMFQSVCMAWSSYNAKCYLAKDFVEAIKQMSSNKFSIITIVLPDDKKEILNAIEQIKIIREITTAPIVVLTHEPYDASVKIKALDEGADDFQVCPGTMEEAIATGRALIRRHTILNSKKEKPITILMSETIIISSLQRKVFVKGQEVKLVRKEFDILSFLIQNQGQVFNHEQIYNAIWDKDSAPFSKGSIWSQMLRLRKKLKIATDVPDYIKSVYGVGYKFEP